MSGKGQCKGESRLRRGGNVDRNAENAQKEKEAESAKGLFVLQKANGLIKSKISYDMIKCYLS